MRAVVWDGVTLRVRDDVDVRPPGPGEVAVEVLASGICHSDLHVFEHGHPPPPVVPGHEAAGLVVALGPGVSGPAVGDPVVVHTLTPCGRCHRCTRRRFTACGSAFGTGATPFSCDGRPVRAYANLSSFASRVTVRASQVVPAPGLAPEAAALVSCAVSTGYGVVRNVAGIGPGDTVVVVGIGGIGVNVLQTARLEGAATLVAVDLNAAKEPVARRFGADAFVRVEAGAGPGDVASAVRAATGAAVDVVVECSGAPQAMAAALATVGPGGTVALVGIPPPGTVLGLDAPAVVLGRRVLGSLNGDIDPWRDIPAILALAAEGRLDLAGQVSAVLPVARVDEAIAMVGRGDAVRVVLDHTAA